MIGIVHVAVGLADFGPIPCRIDGRAGAVIALIASGQDGTAQEKKTKSYQHRNPRIRAGSVLDTITWSVVVEMNHELLYRSSTSFAGSCTQASTSSSVRLDRITRRNASTFNSVKKQNRPPSVEDLSGIGLRELPLGKETDFIDQTGKLEVPTERLPERSQRHRFGTSIIAINDE